MASAPSLRLFPSLRPWFLRGRLGFFGPFPLRLRGGHPPLWSFPRCRRSSDSFTKVLFQSSQCTAILSNQGLGVPPGVTGTTLDTTPIVLDTYSLSSPPPLFCGAPPVFLLSATPLCPVPLREKLGYFLWTLANLRLPFLAYLSRLSVSASSSSESRQRHLRSPLAGPSGPWTLLLLRPLLPSVRSVHLRPGLSRLKGGHPRRKGHTHSSLVPLGF